MRKMRRRSAPRGGPGRGGPVGVAAERELDCCRHTRSVGRWRAPMEDVLCLEKLTVRYGDFVAVDGLDLRLRAGELFGLLGPNGAGKSSTLRVLIGQRKPTAGRVTLA